MTKYWLIVGNTIETLQAILNHIIFRYKRKKMGNGVSNLERFVKNGIIKQSEVDGALEILQETALKDEDASDITTGDKGWKS